jgi:hypothetical protein
MVRKDFGWFNRTLAPDFTVTSHGHTVGRKEALQGYRMNFAVFNTVDSSHSTCLSASTKGDILMALVDGKMTATTISRDAKTVKVVAQVRDREKWAKIGGHWKLETVTIVSDKMTVDGKPIPAQ